jgi:predicted RNA-binding Zn-ribbon protein involved in translation (DUF1610 family)
VNQIAQWNLSGIGCGLLILLGVMGLSAVGLGWIVNGIFLAVFLLALLPVVAVYGLRWWVKRNVVDDQCPMCGHAFAAFNQVAFNCPNCSEALQIKDGRFVRITPPGTIDVDAVEVDVQVLED